jgi:L,D-peptidoglycan transpeptidase YkuD (ErfK/YbiS/YcfS/YnhG family)
MNAFRLACAALLPLLAACASIATPRANAWDNARQLVVVTTPDWNAPTGTLRAFERDAAGDWRETTPGFAVNVGRNGAGWGLGLHDARDQDAGPIKREGDGRAPAGVFAVGTAFGYAPELATGLAYKPMQANDWCIDVPDSPLYNRIVDRSLAKAPGLDQASEPMRRDLQPKPDDLYKVGFVIEHNAQATPQGGSCIFAHVQRAPDAPTAGCTSMPEDALRGLLAWLRDDARPVFVLLPANEYARLRDAWRLPALDDTDSIPR